MKFQVGGIEILIGGTDPYKISTQGRDGGRPGAAIARRPVETFFNFYPVLLYRSDVGFLMPGSPVELQNLQLAIQTLVVLEFRSMIQVTVFPGTWCWRMALPT